MGISFRQSSILTTLFAAGMALAPIAEAHADQCSWVDARVAKKAITWLLPGKTVVSFCEPCGDKAPGPVTTVESVTIATVDSQTQEYVQLLLNGKPVDLAYIYAGNRDGTFTNLATRSGCKAEGVSNQIRPIATGTKKGK